MSTRLVKNNLYLQERLLDEKLLSFLIRSCGKVKECEAAEGCKRTKN